ncbi:substrate-binding domain-containing protein [Dactylosporangium sp. NPDC000244]|uniref:sugar ABC transporter substrate-binding protein n=1 Tax=Dactylosporangium sp. NPDC000244 TaxID=3154365 RepID=UPI00331EDFEC
MKRIMATAAAAALLLTGCGGGGNQGADAPANSSKDVVIGWISPDATSSTRWDTQDRPAFEKAVQTLAPGAKVIASTAPNDQAMLQQAESAITQGAKVLVINPITAEGALPVVDLAKREHVAVISYEGLIAKAHLDGYITFNNLEVGRLQAKYIVDHASPGANIAVMNGAQVCEACIAFKKGAHEVFDPAVQSGKIKIGYEADTPNWEATKAQAQTDQALTKLGDKVDGILAANDGLAGGVIASLKSRQLNGKVVVTGQDATVAGLQEILLGNQTMTVYKDLHKQAQAAAKAAVALAMGKPNETGLTDTYDNGGNAVPALFLQPMAVDRANIKQVFDDGFVTKAQICTGDVASKCDF